MIVAEVAIAVTVIGWFVSPNITNLINGARSSIAGNYKWYKGLPEKLQKLADDLQAIKDTVESVRMGFINEQNKIDRLWRLKDAIHDAEDIMDAFVYEILEAKRRHGLRQAVDSSLDLAKHVFGTKKSLKRIKKLVEGLVQLRQSSQDLRQTLQDGFRPIQRPTTTELSPNDVLFGYDSDYAQLLSMLVPPDGDVANLAITGSKCGGDPKVVAIIGHGGMGKTELARRACKEVEGKFDVFIWVCVYGKFTKTELLREIWKSADGSRPVGEMNDTSIERELIKMVESQRYLLVLDDVCNNELMVTHSHRKHVWDGVLAPFKKHRREESRILMTTRATICSTTLDAGASIILQGINDEAMTCLLKKTAFGDQHFSLSPRLQQVFEKNVGRLHGSPLAGEAVVTDNNLKQNKNASNWEETLMRDYHDSVVYSHLSSYQDLSPQLQRCFSFCSIFPKNWRFDPEKLTDMWIAHGFVEDNGESIKDVARRYFDDLVRRSLLEQDKETKSQYVIHEHIHSMIRRVSAKYCMTITGTLPGSIPASVRHLSVTASCLGQLKLESDGFKRLRTLLILKDDDSSSPLSALDSDILKQFKCVRVLDLTETCITQLPETISKLKFLRYLGLPNTMKNLCDQVTRLLLLEMFRISGKCQLGRFPDDMNSLINVRYLDIDIECIAMIAGIGRLDKLQGSVEFHANKRRQGHSMSELAGMKSLRRTLSIKGLETVASTPEAEQAQLTKTESLKVLKLEWAGLDLQKIGATSSSSDDIATAVIQGLQPHPNLHELHITSYPGTKMSPTWLAKSSVLKNLTRLYIRNCRNLLSLPSVGLLPLLKVLYIKELSSVERVHIDLLGSGAGEFLSLEKIVLEDMRKLVAWDDVPPVVFPRLREVRISDCQLLSSLSGLECCRRSLSLLCVERCPKITPASLPTNFNTGGFPSLATGLLRIVGPTLQLEELPGGAH